MPPSTQITCAAVNVRYSVLFAVVAALMCVPAVTHRGWYLLSLWPAVAFAGLSVAYFTGNVRIFGKRPDGTLMPLHTIVLLPVIVLLLMVFHLARVLSREPAFHSLTENILIGRRLLSREFPPEVHSVIDLTSEFTEPARLRQAGYHSFPILDASVPTESRLHDWLRQTDDIAGTIYIHCAQGHGRTALFAACLLLHRGLVATADEGLALIQSRRPHARLNAVQDWFLRDIAPRILRTNRTT